MGTYAMGSSSPPRSRRAPRIRFSRTVLRTTRSPPRGRAASRAGRQFTVFTGLLLVNLDRMEYGANDRVTASFSLLTNVMTAPTFYYEVFDTSAFPFTLVESGVVTTPRATAGPGARP